MDVYNIFITQLKAFVKFTQYNTSGKLRNPIFHKIIVLEKSEYNIEALRCSIFRFNTVLKYLDHVFTRQFSLLVWLYFRR